MNRRTLLRSGLSITTANVVTRLARSASAAPQAPTVYEPSKNDPRIVAALNARNRLGAAMLSGDFKAVETIFAPDLVVHSPINMVVNRENVLARLRSGQISYEPDYVRKVDFAGVRGDAVVIMGEEIVDPIGNAPNAGKTVLRRFTDIWKSAMLTLKSLSSSHTANTAILPVVLQG